MAESCPCGTGEAYEACCGPLHSGDAQAETAEQLMRSRFAAYAKDQIDYLIETLHRSQRKPGLRESLLRSNEGVEWRLLTILDRRRGGAEDLLGQVEFRAVYREDQLSYLQERSNFVKEGERWFYVDGELKSAELSRNDPCWCGEGKKFKKCHGR